MIDLMDPSSTPRPGLSAVPEPADSPEGPEIVFVHPMPGFAPLTRFALVRLDSDGTLCALRSLEEPEIRFLVVPAARFYPGYSPVVDEEAVELLEEDPRSTSLDQDIVVMLVLTAGRTLQHTTANLRAPVLVSVRTGRAAQVLLDDDTLSLNAPLIA